MLLAKETRLLQVSVRNAPGRLFCIMHTTLSLSTPRNTLWPQTIDKLKIKAAVPNRTERVARLLVRLAAPKRWPAQGGGVLEVGHLCCAYGWHAVGPCIVLHPHVVPCLHSPKYQVITPEVAHAAQLATAYSALATPWQGMEPRLAALLEVKLLAKEVDCRWELIPPSLGERATRMV